MFCHTVNKNRYINNLLKQFIIFQKQRTMWHLLDISSIRRLLVTTLTPLNRNNVWVPTHLIHLSRWITSSTITCCNTTVPVRLQRPQKAPRLQTSSQTTTITTPKLSWTETMFWKDLLWSRCLHRLLFYDFCKYIKFYIEGDLGDILTQRTFLFSSNVLQLLHVALF